MCCIPTSAFCAVQYVFLCAAPLTPVILLLFFVDGSDSDEKPLKGSSLCSLNGNDTVGDSVSRDSLVDYADGEGEFNEDGSFIGEYSGPRHRGSVSEPNRTGPVVA